jgi:hypothetical protein
MNLRELWERRWIELTIAVLAAAWLGCAGLCALTGLGAIR